MRQQIKGGKGLPWMVQCLRLHASTAGDTGQITGQGTKIPPATWPKEKKKLKEGKGEQQDPSHNLLSTSHFFDILLVSCNKTFKEAI